MERTIGHRAPVLWLVLPTMGGFALARALPPGWGGGWWFVLAAVGVTVAALAAWSRCRGGPRRLPAAAWGAGLLLGVAAAACGYFQLREDRLMVWDDLPPREAELVIEVERVFPRSSGRATTSGLARIVAAPPLIAETTGRRVFFSVQFPESSEPLVVSARLRARGVLSPIARSESEGFTGYLASSGVAFKFNRARWLEQVAPPSLYWKWCAQATSRFEAILGQGLDDQPRRRAVYVGMLLGRRAELDEGQRELFLHSGTMHLFAVSGLHIGVIWLVLAALLDVARVPRLAGVLLGLAVLWLHVQITGASPSAVRAWLMIAFVVGARSLRWARNPLAGIAASALVVLWWDPWQLFGLGFRMSYLVVTALLLYGLVLDERWQRRWRPWAEVPVEKWKWWQRAVKVAGKNALTGAALSVAATLVSLPLSMEGFGLLTPGALAVNLVCIPLASLAIMAGVASLLSGLLGLGPLCVVFNHAAALVIAVVEWLLANAVRVPGVYWPAEFRAGWAGVAVLGLFVAVVLAGYSRRWRGRWRLWVPVVVMAVLLAATVRPVRAPDRATPPGAGTSAAAVKTAR